MFLLRSEEFYGKDQWLVLLVASNFLYGKNNQVAQ